MDKNNPPLDHKGMNYMYYAISYKLPYVVEILLELGFKPEKQLLILAEKKNDFVIKKLLEHNVMTSHNKTNNCFQCICYKKKIAQLK